MNGTLFDVINLPVAVLGSKITHFLQDNRPIFGVIDRRLIAVSYTHLDVYKRQLLCTSKYTMFVNV